MSDILGKIGYIILHCSDTEDGPSESWPAIRRYHREVNGWRDIGYHYGVERVGSLYRLQLGRAPWLMGAHCRGGGRNHDSIGVCVIGKYDTTPPSTLIYRAAIGVLADLAYLFRVPADRIHGHREFEPAKTCPGLAWDLDAVRLDVARRLASENVTTSPAVREIWR